MHSNDPMFEKYRNAVPKWGPIGETVFKRTYSQTLNAEAIYDAMVKKLAEPETVIPDAVKETWIQTVIRAVDGNLGLVPSSRIESGEREALIDLIFNFGALPGGRHLNASGLKGRQFLFNCHASGWDPKDPSLHFTFLFDALMQGGGVGSNYSNRYMETMPAITRSIDLHLVCDPDHADIKEFHDLLCPLTDSEKPVHDDAFIVEDSREGWVDAVKYILNTAWSESGEARLVIDVSKIRRRGSPLRRSGGIACGPGPLVRMLANMTKHVNGCIGRKFTSLDAMVIDHTLSDCVVAGGKRRSSRMAIKNWKDHDIFEFINCKRTDGAHWTTNISVEIDNEFTASYDAGDEHAKAVMRAVILGKRTNGEPGLWNIDLARVGEREPEKMYCPNPCGEICLHMWENCNLGHVNLEYFAKKSRQEMMEAFRLMTRWLTRATFGDIPSAQQREVVNRNRRIGVGFFGFHGFLSLRGIKYSEAHRNEDVKKILRQARETVQAEAGKYSAHLEIPAPVKNTTLAPTGTTSSLVGTSSSAQTIVDPWYLRRVRYADNDPELAVKKSEGYVSYPDPDAQNTTIVEYWCEDPLVSKVRAAGWDVSIVESQKQVSVNDYLQMQAVLQEEYADNAISFTIPLAEHNTPTEEDMEKSLVAVLKRVKGTTMYPDKSRKNSPFESITQEQFENYKGRKEVAYTEVECIGGCPV